MIKTNEFNQNLYYLGAVCKYGHIYKDLNKSLRQKSNRTCVECQKEIKKKYVRSNFDLCAERNRLWRKRIANKKSTVSISEKKCSVCKNIKSVQEFYTEKYSLDKLRSHCISCDLERQQKYRFKHRKPRVLKDPELIRQNRRKIKNRYKKSVKGKLANTIAFHRRKANLKAVESQNYTPTQVLERFAKFGNKCVYCGRKEKVSIDHFIPVSKGGADKIENIVPACIFCNSSKNNKLPEFWFKSRNYFSEEKWQDLLQILQIPNIK